MIRTILFLAIIGLSACSDDEITALNNGPYLDCYLEDEWNVFKIRDALEGRWNLNARQCAFIIDEPDVRNSIQLEFRDDDELVVRNDGNVIQRASWQVVSGFDGFYYVETEPFIEFTLGPAIICNNQVLFNDAPLDGCDHYFNKN